MSEEKKDFVVKDRRIFSDDRADREDDKKAEQKGDTAQAAAEGAKPDDRGSVADEEENYALPEINFPTFIFSLNSSALVHLGVIEDPATGKSGKNLPMAKQTIDILGMIEEKTKGNLSDDEAHMLKHILYELRIIYVKEKG